jgi:hypothetical protein
MTYFQILLLVLCGVFTWSFAAGRSPWAAVVGVGLVLATFVFDIVFVTKRAEEEPEGADLLADVRAVQAEINRMKAERDEVASRLTALSVVVGLKPKT